MWRRGLLVILVLCLASMMSGCATICKKKTTQIDELKNRVSSLEAQLQEKDQEIANLREALIITTQKPTGQQVLEEKAAPTIKEIQTALKNAGFDPGPIDGKIGAKTKEAIKAFQKANGLAIDGKVDKKTWELLSAYLSKKTK